MKKNFIRVHSVTELRSKKMDKPKKPFTLLSSMSVLFYMTKFFGVVPYGLGAYYKKKILKFSIIGNIWAIVVTMLSFVSSHIESASVNSGDTDGSGKFFCIVYHHLNCNKLLSKSFTGPIT